MKKIAFSFLFTAVTLAAQTNLSGSVGGMLLEKTGNPFIVSENITVPAGEKLTVDAGCIFLFHPFTGVEVEGQMGFFELKGTVLVLVARADGEAQEVPVRELNVGVDALLGIAIDDLGVHDPVDGFVDLLADLFLRPAVQEHATALDAVQGHIDGLQSAGMVESKGTMAQDHIGAAHEVSAF